MWKIPRCVGLKSNNLKKLNDHSFFKNPSITGFPDITKFLALFAQDIIDGFVKSFQGRYSREGGSPQVVEFPGFPLSRE